MNWGGAQIALTGLTLNRQFVLAEIYFQLSLSLNQFPILKDIVQKINKFDRELQRYKIWKCGIRPLAEAIHQKSNISVISNYRKKYDKNTVYGGQRDDRAKTVQFFSSSSQGYNQNFKDTELKNCALVI